ncbi:MAG TPA: Do family serine endopeptidase [Candidatus Binataceae bacterium]|nr:Do family serine endopeptidase [Candidatus Binataceae bacterium]
MPSKAGNVAIFCFAAVMLLLCGPAVPRALGDQFWRELASPRVTKADTLPDFVALADKLGPAVVNISTEQAGPAASEGEGGGSEGGGNEPFNEFGEPFGEPHGRSLGSGFIINAAGYILTNDHVVENGREIIVTTKDGNQYKASVVGRDAKTDIALLKINARHDLPVAPLGDSDEVKVGQWVMTIGDPFGFDHTVTAGIVSAKGRFIPGNYDDFIQTDAAINPGNSGGPLINIHGEVVGVNSAIFTRTGSNTGIGFAIPVNLVKEELPQLREHGKVVRGWLGIYVQRVTPAIADSMGLEEPRGALVAEVLSEGPAKSAGVKRGDVIAAYNGTPIEDSRELPLMVARTPLGHSATLRIVRDKKYLELPVTITASRETHVAAAAKKPIKGSAPFGLTVKDLDPGLAHDMGLGQSKGVVVYSVQPGSSADVAGLRSRDIIVEVNRQGVGNLDAYQRAIKSGGGKALLLLIKRHNSTVFVPLEPEG